MNREAMNLALEALEKQHNWMVANGGGEMFAIPSKKAINELRQALAQPEQKPVAWSDVVSDGGLDPRNVFDTAPPKREWVGLTVDEILETLPSSEWKADVTLVFAKAIEAKLKEKNA